MLFLLWKITVGRHNAEVLLSCYLEVLKYTVGIFINQCKVPAITLRLCGLTVFIVLFVLK